MIVELIADESVKASDKLFYVLFEVGYATKQQLADILGWNVYKVENTLKYIRKHHEAKGVKWIETEQLTANKKGRPFEAFCLSKYAIQQIKEVRGVESNVKPPKPIQLNHYLGITNIFARMMKTLTSKYWTRMEWWSEDESRQFVINQYYNKIRSVAPNTKLTPSQLMKILAPDAYLRIMRQSFWIEFDNSTEKGKKLQDRFMRYIKTYYPRKNGYAMVVKSIEFPVVWVTKTESRRRYMERKWEEVKDKCQRDIKNARTKFPTMYFIVEGNETPFLIEYARQLQPVKPTPRPQQS